MSYVIINYPKFKAFTSAGVPAVGYKLYTYAPGTTTDQATYSERTLTSANTNPITLDSAGECVIYTGQTVKLVLKTAALATVWTFDYLGEQQATYVTGAATATSEHNQYAVATTPAVGALTENLTLIMTPDVTNTTTLTSNVFTGTGIDDCTESGAYTGTTAGSIYYVEIDGAFEAAPTAPTAVETNDVGLVTVGNHYVKISFVTAIGETTLSAASAVVAADGAETIAVSNIATGSAQVTARKVYMTEAGGTDYYLVDTIPDNSTTTYTISIADATLAGNDPAPTSDTTGIADTFKWKKDAGAYTTGVAITGAAQTLAEGVKVTFAVIAGHTLGDLWAITVETPARVNLDTLGNLIVYKNKNGVITPLDGGDMVAGYPAQLVLNGALDAWLLINPATPTVSTVVISAKRYRRTLSGDYNQILADEGYELSFTATATVTLLTPPEFANRFMYVRNSSETGIVTIDAGSYAIYGSGDSTYAVGPGHSVQIQTNGVDWHIMTSQEFGVIERATPSAAASVSFDVAPGIKYRLDYNLDNGTGNQDLYLRFNSVATGYQGRIFFFNDSSHGATAETIGILLGIALAQNTTATGAIEFTTDAQDDTIIIATGMSYFYNGLTTLYNGAMVMGRLDAAADLSTVSIVPASGDLTGNVQLIRIG